MPTSRLDAFDNCRELWRECQRWLGDIEATRLAHNQAFTEAMLEQYREFFDSVGVVPAQCVTSACGSERRALLLVLAGAGSGKTSVLVARAGWLLAREKPRQIKFCCWHSGRQAAQEMDERIRERLASDDITARTFHSLALHIIQQGSKKVPTISKLESDTAARHALLLKSWQKAVPGEKSAGERLAPVAGRRDGLATAGGGTSGRTKGAAADGQPA